MQTLEIGLLKRAWISAPVRATSSSQGARASPPTMYQVPRYDAIAVTHRAGAKKNPKAIYAAVAPRLDLKSFADIFRDSSRNGRLTARASASSLGPATMQIPRVTLALHPVLHFGTLTLADLAGLNALRALQDARQEDTPMIERPDAGFPPTNRERKDRARVLTRI